jgi:hypothetical protein
VEGAAVEMATVEPLLYRTALNLASNKRRSSRLWRFIGMDDAGDPPSREKISEREARARADARARKESDRSAARAPARPSANAESERVVLLGRDDGVRRAILSLVRAESAIFCGAT